jgi:hypothetical protein
MSCMALGLKHPTNSKERARNASLGLWSAVMVGIVLPAFVGALACGNMAGGACRMAHMRSAQGVNKSVVSEYMNRPWAEDAVEVPALPRKAALHGARREYHPS